MTLTGFPAFHSEFFQLVELLFENDPQLCPLFTRYLLAHWPVREPRKQALFLDGLHDLVATHGRQLPRELLRLCFMKMASLFDDCAPDLAQQSLSIFGDAQIIELLARMPGEFARDVYNRAYRVSDAHWADHARWAADAVVHGIYSACARFKEKEKEGETAETVETWEMIRRQAQCEEE
jgi:hypothetical protein